jgi:hypothetical protein
MKKKIFLAILIIILLCPLWMWLLWLNSPKRAFNILIVDKTVLNYPAQEHESINWVLNYNRFVKPDSNLYSSKEDYLGFFPMDSQKYIINSLESRTDSEIHALSTILDAAYFSDSYGIYDNDWYGGDITEFSPKIYGGLDKQDILLMRDLQKQKKLLIAEFNNMNSPSSLKSRDEFENLYGIRWTGWIGKFYEDLSNTNADLPAWVIRKYEKVERKKWAFQGPGILLLSESAKIIVLEQDKHLISSKPIITSTKNSRKEYNIPEEIEYPFWFEINQTNQKNNVISVFSLKTTELGDSILNTYGILKNFPATIENLRNGQNMYYFCADYADNPINTDLSIYKHVSVLKNLTSTKRKQSQREMFFYNYYLPMMNKILNRYYKNHNSRFRVPIPYHRTL